MCTTAFDDVEHPRAHVDVRDAFEHDHVAHTHLDVGTACLDHDTADSVDDAGPRAPVIDHGHDEP